MAMIPNKFLYENAEKYFKNKLNKKEKRVWEKTLKSELKVVKEVFK